MKKVVMVIAAEKFRDEEFFEPKAVLEQNGIGVSVASTTTGEATGKLGARVRPDLLIDNAKVSDFDGVVFVGGPGSSGYWDDPRAHKLAREMNNAGKVTAAICDGAVTLARSGILKGRRATVYPGSAEHIKNCGAIYTAKPVEIDAKIVTASGPAAAKDFGKALVEALK